MRKYAKIIAMIVLFALVAGGGTSGWRVVSIEADGDLLLGDPLGRESFEIVDADHDDVDGHDGNFRWDRAEGEQESSIVLCMVGGAHALRGGKTCAPSIKMPIVATRLGFFAMQRPKRDIRKAHRVTVLASSSPNLLIRTIVLHC